MGETGSQNGALKSESGDLDLKPQSILTSFGTLSKSALLSALVLSVSNWG